MEVIRDKSGSLLVTAGELVCFKQPLASKKTSTWKFCFSNIPGYTENRTGKTHLRAVASETRSFRRSLSGQVALLCIT